MKINFEDRWKEKIEKEEKKITIRYGDKYKNIKEGDLIDLAINGKVVKKAIIKKIYKKKVSDLEKEAELEGITLEELKKLLNRYYGIKDDDEVFVILFEYIL